MPVDVNINYFCGGGFVSRAMENVLGHVDLAVNHDGEAILMHERNHPKTQSMRSDVFDVKLLSWLGPRHIANAWFSPDCKHFSRAKGGQLRDQKVRGLAWVVCRVAGLPETKRPRVIFVENVMEFQTWAPLTRAGKIDKRHIDRNKLGSHFRTWVGNLRALGYKVEWRVLMACDYGDPTIRKRLFVIARCDGMPIVWPRATHCDPASLSDNIFAQQAKPWRPAADIIDWSIPSPSIFERKKPLAEATCRRIAAGVMRYVVNHPNPFIAVMGYGERTGQRPRTRSLTEPLHTIPAGGKKAALVSPFISYAQHNSGVIGRDARTPLSTIVQRGTTQNPVVVKMEARRDHSGAVSAFLIEYYGNGKARDLRDPLGTVTTKDRFALISQALNGYGIVDIGMRMLSNRELARAMSVPDDFDLCEDALTKTSITAKIGNGVPRLVVEALLRANASIQQSQTAHFTQHGGLR